MLLKRKEESVKWKFQSCQYCYFKKKNQDLDVFLKVFELRSPEICSSPASHFV